MKELHLFWCGTGREQRIDGVEGDSSLSKRGPSTARGRGKMLGGKEALLLGRDAHN